MSITNSPNMTLPIPGVGTELGPAYAFDIDNCLTLIDSHDHTPGRGVQITPAGININVNLPFNGNSATSLLNTVFNAQSTATSVLQALSVAPGSEITPLQDLWYTDSAGNKVQITSNGALAAVSTTVQGISYALGTFAFRQTQDSLPTTPANLDAGSVTIRPTTAGTPFGVTLSPSGGISSLYTLTLPLPVVQTSFVTQDPSGVLSGSVPIAGGIVQSNLAANSVGTSQLINSNVTTSKLANGAVTPIKNTVVVVSSSFGPTSIPTAGPSLWYAVPSNLNSITLAAGTYRLSGSVNWTSNTNVVEDLRIGWFGANGNNTTTVPAALVCTMLGGRLGAIFVNVIQSSLGYANYFVNAPETIIVLSTTTTVYLNLYHNSASGSVVNYQGELFAQQIG